MNVEFILCVYSSNPIPISSAPHIARALVVVVRQHWGFRIIPVSVARARHARVKVIGQGLYWFCSYYSESVSQHNSNFNRDMKLTAALFASQVIFEEKNTVDLS